jgi:hypothetical protein
MIVWEYIFSVTGRIGAEPRRKFWLEREEILVPKKLFSDKGGERPHKK